PGWARNRPVPGSLYSYVDAASTMTTLTVAGKRVAAVPDALGYVTLDRVWKDGDTIAIEFPFDVKRVAADERVQADRGRMAIECGPIVYCAEWPDCDGGKVFDLLVDKRAQLEPSVDRELSGATVLTTTAHSASNPTVAAKPVRLIPYHLWANRGAGEMSVWLPTRELKSGDIGPANGFIFYVNPNYATDGWRYLEAAPFDQSAGAKWGCFRRAIEGARGTAVGTGMQNTRDMLAACTERGGAADLCATLTVNGVGGWFLPSRDELALMYRHLKASAIGEF